MCKRDSKRLPLVLPRDEVPPPQAAVIESVAKFMKRVTHMEFARCPYCENGRLRVVASLLPQRDFPNLHGPP